LSAFLKRWLDPRLSKPIGVQTIRSDGWQQFVKKIAARAQLHLEGPKKHDIIAAIGLLDLYGPTFYPQHLSLVNERVSWAKRDLEGKVNHAKFRMFFAVHELEAWILAQPPLLPPAVAQALPASATSPESVNFNCPPSKLLDRLYDQNVSRKYKKTVDGTNLFAVLDPAAVYAKCPYFKEMLDEMHKLAKDAGL